MATLNRGQTFGATETVTNTKLHNLVDLGSISGIVNADISASAAIVDTKLADITTGSKVSGSALANLATIPSGAGVIPSANLPVLGTTMVSLVSIPNTSLLPLTLASWVDGASFRNLASVPTTAGLFNYNTIVSSLASGGSVIYDGSNNFVGGSSSAAHTAGDVLQSYADTENSHSSGSYTKVKEIVIPSSGTLRIKFDLKSGTASQQVQGRVYRDGVAVGTAQSTSSTSYTTYSEDISGWTAGDLCQLYTNDGGGAASVECRNFRIYETTPRDFLVTQDD